MNKTPEIQTDMNIFIVTRWLKMFEQLQTICRVYFELNRYSRFLLILVSL